MQKNRGAPEVTEEHGGSERDKRIVSPSAGLRVLRASAVTPPKRAPQRMEIKALPSKGKFLKVSQ